MNYIIEANLGIVFLYSIYVLVLGRETDFGKQRIALLSLLGCALIFPLVQMSPRAIDPPILSAIILPEVTVNATSSPRFAWGYLIVMLIVALPTILAAIKLYRIAKEDGRYHGDYFIIESNNNFPSWSFFNLIYIGRAGELSDDDKNLVVKHEMLHGRLFHSVDMLFITFLCIIFWFNPVLWIMRRTLAKVHEFEVDSIIAQQDGSVDYSMLLAKTALKENGFLLTHHFNQSFILKRINMINMIKSRISNWKFAGLGFAVTLYFIGVACTEPTQAPEVIFEEPQKVVVTNGEVHTDIEQMPTPRNGMDAFIKELGGILKYPEAQAKAGVEGKVFIEFIVNVDGSFSELKVIKGIGAEADREALRAVGELSNWNPGKKDGKAVRTKVVLPITFKLQD